MPRLFAGYQPTLEEKTFTSSQTFVIPAGVTNLISVSGKGSNGTSGYVARTSVSVMNVHYMGANPPPEAAGNANWSNFSGAEIGPANDFYYDGSAVFTSYNVYVWDGGRNTMSSYNNSAYGYAESSIAYTDMPTSGPITRSGTCGFYYDYYVSGSAGQSSTGFGKTFPGGAEGQQAPITTFENVTVTPGSSHSLTVRSGGYIKISYLK